VAIETSPHIRLLVPADAALYRDVRLEGLKQNPEAFGSAFDFESDKPPSWFAERIAGSEIFGAFVEGQLLGVAGYRQFDGPKQRHKGLLWGMYVRGVARKLGLGKRLVAAVIAHAADRIEQLGLTVVVENLAAQRLYSKLGFVEYGREKHALKQDGRYYDEILMVRFLGPPGQTGQNRM
jgi:ribosomal protein S18 acetylase RimI-like enzyme